ncbi:MAG: ATP-binding cassette domain-containing protein [Chloroflexi bacterium]|nr:ATP-binding cassette domain-containing protein [Chloroflexota bacterium]
MQDQAIQVENLVKKYGKFTAVNGINFSVKQGDIFAFLGPNGAGKTTTIKILCTLARPTSGKAIVNNFDVVHQQQQVRQSIGLVFQDPSLDEKLTGYQNLKFHAMVYNIPSSDTSERIEKVMNMVELWDRRNNQVKAYSGGMKRRLELARGLLHRPRVLFLDEPTLGLDPQTRNRIWDYILELQKQEGTTIFMTTHYMDEAEKANRIAIIDNGKIVAIDTPDALKEMVGKDIITIRTVNDDKAVQEIKSRYDITPRKIGNDLVFEKENGDEFLPVFIKEANTKILSITLRRPSLDDVFLKLTGKEIREDETRNGFKLDMRQRHKMMGH